MFVNSFISPSLFLSHKRADLKKKIVIADISEREEKDIR